jgi:hypothetical protein
VILNLPHFRQPDLGLFVGLQGGMFICERAGESVTDFVADPDEGLHFVEQWLQHG